MGKPRLSMSARRKSEMRIRNLYDTKEGRSEFRAILRVVQGQRDTQKGIMDRLEIQS